MAEARLRSEWDRAAWLKAGWVGRSAFQTNPFRRRSRRRQDPKAAVEDLAAQVMPSRAPHLEEIRG